VLRLSDEETHAKFVEIRFAENAGAPFCPRCGSLDANTIPTRRTWQCKACKKQFSVTSGTIFASRKLPIGDYLAAIAIFCNEVKGKSMLALSRDLGVQYKTGFVLAHKIRESIGATVEAENELSREVEIDGAYFGGHVKPENRKADRGDRRLAEEQTGKRQVVVVIRERNGPAVPVVVDRESAAVPAIRSRVVFGTIIHADEARASDVLRGSYDTRRVNHSVEFKSDDGASTNWAKSYFARLRRGEIGHHHHIAGPYLSAFARECAWRENMRRQPNGALLNLAARAALSRSKSETSEAAPAAPHQLIQKQGTTAAASSNTVPEHVRRRAIAGCHLSQSTQSAAALCCWRS
jgi:transposase-like protein